MKSFDGGEVWVIPVFREVVGKTDFDVLLRDIVSVNQAHLNFLIRVGVFAFFNVGAVEKEATIDLQNAGVWGAMEQGTGLRADFLA